MSTLKERFLNVPKPFSSGSSQPAEEVKEPVQSDVKLKKSVDLFSGIALIVGTMIGKFWPKFQKYFNTKSMFFSRLRNLCLTHWIAGKNWINTILFTGMGFVWSCFHVWCFGLC